MRAATAAGIAIVLCLLLPLVAFGDLAHEPARALPSPPHVALWFAVIAFALLAVWTEFGDRP